MLATGAAPAWPVNSPEVKISITVPRSLSQARAIAPQEFLAIRKLPSKRDHHETETATRKDLGLLGG